METASKSRKWKSVEPEKLDKRQSGRKDRTEYLRKYQAAWSRKRRLAWLAANGPCRQCGSDRRLEVDHIDPAQKVDHKVWSWSAAKRNAELAKCQVLCHECHKEKTRQYVKAIKTGRPGTPKKLNIETAYVIKVRALAGEPLRALAREFGLSHSTVANIRDGKFWAHAGKGAA